jgi:hypothetical protein
MSKDVQPCANALFPLLALASVMSAVAVVATSLHLFLIGNISLKQKTYSAGIWL